MREEGGGGENAPTVEELKAQVAVSNAGREGLDEKGLIRRERVRGLEEWIDKGRVKMFYMKFKSEYKSCLHLLLGALTRRVILQILEQPTTFML